MEYKESRPGIDVLQQRIDDFISAHEAKLEQVNILKNIFYLYTLSSINV